MKKIINYEKDILFKTNIGEICSISLEHDFTVDEGVLRGDFLIDGEYKANELSINKEAFSYRLPLEYELEPNVDVETLSYDIDNFEYTVKDDCLTVIIDFGIRYDERAVTPVIPDITEEEINLDDFELPKFSEMQREAKDDASLIDEKDEIKIEEESMKDDDTRNVGSGIDEEDKEIILSSTMEEDEYITYHVHVVEEGDTLEGIAKKYSTSVEMIKEYNSCETLEVKSKLIIPIVNE